MCVSHSRIDNIVVRVCVCVCVKYAAASVFLSQKTLRKTVCAFFLRSLLSENLIMEIVGEWTSASCLYWMCSVAVRLFTDGRGGIYSSV